jgi:hypothetical protein
MYKVTNSLYYIIIIILLCSSHRRANMITKSYAGWTFLDLKTNQNMINTKCMQSFESSWPEVKKGGTKQAFRGKAIIHRCRITTVEACDDYPTCDASAKANGEAPSLNQCLNPGPPLQNDLWNILVRMRFHPIALSGDIKQAFLQVRIK